MTNINDLYARADQLTMALANKSKTMGEIVKERDDIIRIVNRSGFSSRYRHVITDKLGYIDSILRGAA